MSEHKVSRRKMRAISNKREVWYCCLKERAILAPVVDRLEDIAMTAGAYGYGKLSQPPARTDQARNWLAKTFLKATAANERQPMAEDILIMLDNDHLHHKYTLVRLALQITDRSGGRGIVGALTERRKPPYDPLAFIRGDDGKLCSIKPAIEGLIECAAIGHGAIAIARWVFEDLAAAGKVYPWWRYAYADDNDVMPSEDIYFGQLCEDIGISMWVDAGLEAPHMINHYVTMADTEAYLQAHPETAHGSVSARVSKAIESEAIC